MDHWPEHKNKKMKTNGSSPAPLTKGGSLPRSEEDPGNALSRFFRGTGSKGFSGSRSYLLQTIAASLASTVRGARNGASRDDTLREFFQQALTQRLAEERSAGRREPMSEKVSAPESVLARHETGDENDTSETGDGEPLRQVGSVPRWKRIFDTVFIVLASPVLLPLMLLVMLAVRISSPGPIFFKQKRVGLGGRPFMIYKFRSMRVDAETGSHESHFTHLMRQGVPMMKLDAAGDPRIVPWGRLLRATGMDELPQLFNVVRGEMSLVGPRPSTLQEFEHFTSHEKRRVEALPGLTGYWQVNGKNKTTFEQMIRLDLFYVSHSSPGLDLLIMVRTIPALLGQALDLWKTSAGRPRMNRGRAQPLHTRREASGT